MVGIAVNYYWRPNFPESVRLAAGLALRMIRENDLVGEVVAIDGSPHPDPQFRVICGQTGVRYIHTGRELNLAEGYNIGWRALSEEHVGLMASDVFPPRETVSTLMLWLLKPDVGCVFPYLTYADYPAQISSFVRQAVSCEPSAMTLNLNLFKRSVLEAAGGVNERYSGAYNDVILLAKIRQLGYRGVLVGGTQVTHMGRTTTTHGSNYRKKEDARRFSEEYSHLFAAHGKFNIRHWQWPLASGRFCSWAWLIAQKIPSTRLRRPLERFVLTREPEWTRYPAAWGKSAPRQ